ncbi:helix-hairpin-helix domain-containing protein [[Pasteurella] aerogenes]|nr:helix-hairpin-helix domain-containing protein [[Pasteurella] aerogenes]MDY2796981.1 helix-hairpin-helix domain-containing protein [[Pasteurella] aerogenes]
MQLFKSLSLALGLLSALLGANSALAATDPPPKPAIAEQTAPVILSDTLNINTATAEEIQSALLGIGAKKAEAIVEYREKHGNFTAPEQLLEIQGIGKATLEKNKDRIVF